MLKTIKNQKGISLINVMIALGVMSIVIAGVTSALVYMMKETRHLESKLGVLELQRTLTGISPGINICAAAVSANPNMYKVKKEDFLKQKFNLSKLALDAAGTQVLVEASAKVLGVPYLKTKTIRIENLFETSAKIVGDLVIDFESERSFRPITHRVLILTVDDGTDITFTGCNSSSPQGGSSGGTPSNKESCEAVGGYWVEPGGSRPSFCSIHSDILEWY